PPGVRPAPHRADAAALARPRPEPSCPDCGHAPPTDRRGPSPPVRVTLPLPLRNRLADLILDALRDDAARRGLEALAAVCADPRALGTAEPPRAFPDDLFEKDGDGWTIRSGHPQHAGALGERASRAARALTPVPLAAAEPPPDAPLSDA